MSAEKDTPMQRLMIRCRGSLLHTILAGVFLVCCDATPPAQNQFWRPWYDTPDASDSVDLAIPIPDLAVPVDALPPAPADLAGSTDLRSGAPDLATMPSICSLSVAVTTTSAGGRYAPRNIGAIWISDDSDHFIKTLTIWADKRVKELKLWNQVTTAAKVPADRTDAISGATKTSHGVRTGTWNCTNTARLPVADGAYKVCFELTDADSQGPNNCVPFTKGATPLSLRPADSPSFTARQIEFTP